MMMQRSHQEDTLPLAILAPRVFEIASLNHHRAGLGHEYTSRDDQHEGLMNQDGDNSERSAKCQRTGVTHEYLSGMTIEPEKSQSRADDCRAEDRQFSSPRHVRDLKIRCNLHV